MRITPRWVDWWTKMLWDAMSRTGKGYRMPSMRRAKSEARRGDKLKGIGADKRMRSYFARYGGGLEK